MESEDDAGHNIRHRHDCVCCWRSGTNRRALFGDQPFPHLWRLHPYTISPTHFILDVSDPVNPATLDASDFTVNGIPADNVTLSNGDLTIEFIFNTSPAVPGLNTMHIPAGAFNCVTNGPVLEFTCTFGFRILRPRPFPTPYPRP